MGDVRACGGHFVPLVFASPTTAGRRDDPLTCMERSYQGMPLPGQGFRPHLKEAMALQHSLVLEVRMQVGDVAQESEAGEG